MDWVKGNLKVSTDKGLLETDTVYKFLSERSYWAQGRTREQVEKSIENSICYGLYLEGKQIGFARVITDFAVMYYMCDLFILEANRGNGLGKYLVECIVNTPELKGLKGMLNTRDAQGLYRKYGFKEIGDPNNCMVKRIL